MSATKNINIEKISGLAKTNLSATTSPTSTDDINAGYGVGSFWVDTVTGKVYFCTDATVGSAVWVDVSSSASIYTQDDTIGSGRVATLTDTLTFDNAQVIIQGDLENNNYPLTIKNSLGDTKFRVKNGGNVDMNGVNINITDSTLTSTLYLQKTTFNLDFGYNGVIGHSISFKNNASTYFYQNGWSTNKGFILGSSTKVGSENISFQGRTLVKGADTLSTSTAFEIYDGDTTPAKLWDFRNNGDVYIGKASTVHLQGNQLDFDNGQTTFRGVGTTVTTASLRAENSSGTRTFSVANDGTGYFLKDLDVTERLRVNGGSTSLGFSAAIKGNVNLLLEDLASSKIVSFASTGNRFIATTKFGHNSNATGIVEIRGSNTSSATSDFKIEDSAASSIFEVRNNGDIYTNGTLTLSSGRLQNTIVNPTVQETTSTATFTINATNENTGVLTAQAAALTVANPTGTIVQGQKLVYRIKDNGTARAITWGANFRAIGVTLPTTTTANKLLYVGCIYNTTDSKWDVVAVNEEA